jgi:hypothetical protein
MEQMIRESTRSSDVYMLSRHIDVAYWLYLKGKKAAEEECAERWIAR